MKNVNKIIKHMLLVLPVIFMMGCGLGKSNPETFIKDGVAEFNKQCPQRIDEITVMTKASYENHRLTFYYELDPGEAADILMDIEEQVIKEALEDEIKNSSDPNVETLFKNLKEDNGSLYYMYSVNDGTGRSRKIKVDY